MSSLRFPIPPTIKSQPNLEVFPTPVVVVGDQIIQLTLTECFPLWLTGPTAVVSGAAPGLDGAWVEGIASTVRAAKWFGITFLQNTNSLQSFYTELDLGVGPAGFEVVAVNDMSYGWQAPALPGGACLATPFTAPLVPAIPAGSRIAVRSKDGNALPLGTNVHAVFFA